MSLVRIKKSTWPASAFDIWQRCMVLPKFENLYWHLGTNIITNFNFWDFELCSFVLSWFFCKFIPPFSFCFSKNSSFQNSFDNYLSTNINIHCLYLYFRTFIFIRKWEKINIRWFFIVITTKFTTPWNFKFNHLSIVVYNDNVRSMDK
jgi:hypothetical protein